MSLRYHERVETRPIINPFTIEKVMLLGEIAGVRPGMRQLDLCCGKAEMIAQWSAMFGHTATGVDISRVFLAAARERVRELGVSDRITLIEGDASTFAAEIGGFDIVSCIGATWIGGGLEGTLHLMRPALAPGGMVLVGEPFWHEPPPREAILSAGLTEEMFTSLDGTRERIEHAGFELVEMVLANQDDWDRYVASQWIAADDWLKANPGHEDAEPFRAWVAHNKADYLRYGRRYLGWGVFVLRPRQ